MRKSIKGNDLKEDSDSRAHEAGISFRRRMLRTDFYEEAWGYFKFGDFENALINIDLAIEEDSLNPKFYILRFEILQSKH